MDAYIHDELHFLSLARKRRSDLMRECEKAQEEEDKHLTNIILYIQDMENSNTTKTNGENNG